MLTSWKPGTPVRCTDHGNLSPQIPHNPPEAGIIMVEHLRDMHGLDTLEAAEALAKVRYAALAYDDGDEQ